MPGVEVAGRLTPISSSMFSVSQCLCLRGEASSQKRKEPQVLPGITMKTCKFQESARAPLILTQTASTGLLKIICRFYMDIILLLKNQNKESIKRPEIMKYFIQHHKNHIPEILRRAPESLEILFGLELKELNVDEREQCYIFINKMGLTCGKGLGKRPGLVQNRYSDVFPRCDPFEASQKRMLGTCQLGWRYILGGSTLSLRRPGSSSLKIWCNNSEWGRGPIWSYMIWIPICPSCLRWNQQDESFRIFWPRTIMLTSGPAGLYMKRPWERRTECKAENFS